ncbi:MAG: S8 family serine peptidase, partial [Candidatus Omnitrophica bacterium]|nr:S8 family serine peptidase [Candidatus Omnitrophota bacterium]
MDKIRYIRKLAVIIPVIAGLILLGPASGSYAQSSNATKEEPAPLTIESIVSTAAPVDDAKEELLYEPGVVLVRVKEGVDIGNVLYSEAMGSARSSRLQSIKPVVGKVMKDYELKKDSDGWYWFFGKEYTEKPSDKKIFEQAYKKMAPAEKALYRIYKVDLAEGESVTRAVSRLKNNRDIEYAQPNYILKGNMVPNDPYYHSSGAWGQDFDDLYALKPGKINCEPAWDMALGYGVVVAVLDTGVNYNHLDLSQNIWSNPGEVANGQDSDGNGYVDDVVGWDFVTNSDDPIDDHGHGSHVAGIVAAVGNNNYGIIGVAPGAKIMPLKVLDDNGNGNTTWVANAITYAADNGARVLNNSLGGEMFNNIPNYVLEDAIRYAASRGCVVLFAAGNDDADVANYHACYMPEVICVGATDPYDDRASFSNWGFYVDVAAPGAQILSLNATQGGAAIYSGTSQACPHVAGLAALLLANNPSLTPAEVKRIIMEGVDAFDIDLAQPDKLIGTGRIDCGRALNVAAVSNGTAIITEPRNLDTIEGIGQIEGVATDDNFSSYRLSHASYEDSENWTEFYSSANERETEGVLCPEFDTQSLSNGNHAIKLEVIDTSGEIAEMIVCIEVENTGITSPFRYDILRAGDDITIFGRLDNDNITSYSIEYGLQPGLDELPLEWVTIIEDAPPAQDEELAYWDTNAIAEEEEEGDDDGGLYTLALRQNMQSGGTNTLYVRNIYLCPFLKTGWPKTIPFDRDDDGNIVRPGILKPVTADLDNDGEAEVIVFAGGNPPKLFAWRARGQEYSGNFPVELNAAAGPAAIYPAVYDMHGDGDQNILLAAAYEQTDAGGNVFYGTRIFCYDNDGLLVEGWPVDFSEGLANSITVADLEGDDDPEIILAYENNTGLLILERNGEVRLNLSNIHTQGLGDPTYPCSNLSVGHFDTDEDLEIVFATTDTSLPDPSVVIHIFNIDGTEVSGWPRSIANAQTLSSPAVGDIDNDDTNDIVISTSRGVYVFNYEGDIASGWPQLTDKNHQERPSPALGDLNGDDELEIIIGDWEGGLHIFNKNGDPADGYPQENFGEPIYSVAAGIMEDEACIVVSYGEPAPGEFGDSRLKNVCIDSEEIDTDTFIMQQGGLPPASFQDIDPGEGNIIGVSIYDYDYEESEPFNRATIYIWEADAEYDSATMFWPMFQHDNANSGCYDLEVGEVSLDSPSAPTGLTATADSTTQIELSWQDNSDNEDGFKIERSLTAGSGFSQI